MWGSFLVKTPMFIECLLLHFFSVMILHDPYFHEISLPIDAGHDELSFVFGKSDIFVIIALRGWQGKW